VRRTALPALTTAVLTLSACTSFADGGDERSGSSEASEAPAAGAVTAEPEALTVVADGDAAALAAATSRALYDSADVVVVARDGDRPGTLLAASAAAGLGVPLLLEPAAAADGTVLDEELDRLGATAVLAVGEAGEGSRAGDVTQVAVPADPTAVAAATGLTWAGEEDAAADAAAAAAALDREEPVALLAGQEGSPPSAGTDGEALPEVEAAEPLEGTVVLATGAPEEVAGLATARAAGARVLLTGGSTDPRAVPEVVQALGGDEASSVVVLGTGFAAEDGLDWKLATAATGVELPAGGQVLFPRSFLVALYGNVDGGALGVLGEQPLPQSIERARRTAAPYEGRVEGTVVPAFEIIATVASASAGEDGDYSAEAPVEQLRPWVEAAGEAGLYVVLDLQPGRTDFLTQAQRYRPLLELPHVGLALDPEWRLGPGEVHLTQIGSVGVEEVNRVVTWLADLTRERRLPQKLLVLHQFRLDMLPGRERVDLSRDELAVMVHADGQGGQGDKQATWRALRQGAPAGLWWGWKNFYDEDLPMLTPEQTARQVRPQPQLISYQ
jgi:hypothetical protein